MLQSIRQFGANMLKRFISCSLLAITAAGPAVAQASDPTAAMFGARESAHWLDLSPDGTRIVHVAPAQNAVSVTTVADLSRLRSLDIDGKNIKALGKSEHFTIAASASSTATCSIGYPEMAMHC